MTIRHLTTFDAVLDAVGGFAALADLIGVSKPLVYAWRRDGRLPAYTLHAVEQQLGPRGFSVSREVFDWGPARATTRKPGSP